MNPRVICAALVLAAVTTAPAQTEQTTDIFKEAAKIGAKGVPKATPPSTSPGKFKPVGKPAFLEKYVAGLTTNPDEAKALTEVLETFLKAQAAFDKANKVENDFIAAMANTIGLATMVLTQREVTDNASLDLAKNLRAAFNVPALKNAKDLQKQEAYETAVYHSAMIAITVGNAKTDQELASAKTLAETILLAMVGAEPAQFVFDSNSFTIKPSGKSQPDGTQPVHFAPALLGNDQTQPSQRDTKRPRE